MVVDGGPPQVAAAAKAMDELGISDVALCGLAKRLEEVWLPDVDEPVILPRTSEGLYLLQRLRDEAHRFAITHHRARRSRSMVESLLDQVPGLGEVRRKALITYFGSLKKLRAASVEEIAAVPGFGPKLAAAIKEALDAKPRGEAINMATGEVLTRWPDNPAVTTEPPDEPTKPLRLVVVTGMSGAGRSTAAHSLEDLGWYVDRQPAAQPCWSRSAPRPARSDLNRVAVVLDVRTREFFEQLPTMFSDLSARRHPAGDPVPGGGRRRHRPAPGVGAPAASAAG